MRQRRLHGTMQRMDTHAMTIRLPEDVYEDLRLAAFEDRTSQTAIIAEAVEKHLAARKAAKQPA